MSSYVLANDYVRYHAVVLTVLHKGCATVIQVQSINILLIQGN